MMRQLVEVELVVKSSHSKAIIPHWVSMLRCSYSFAKLNASRIHVEREDEGGQPEAS